MDSFFSASRLLLSPHVYQFLISVRGGCGALGTGLGYSFDGQLRSGRKIEALQVVRDGGVCDPLLALLAGKSPTCHMNLALQNFLN
jgi:hypothetical protein